MTKRRSAAAARYRRRGSVLVLVMTLLGILFVTGVAFLASMSFESQIVGLERGRDRQEEGVESVLEETVSALREGVIGDGDAPFGGKLDEPFTRAIGEAPAALGELPGVHDLFAPIEPVPDVSGDLVFENFTDLPSLMGSGDASFAVTRARRVAARKVNVALPSGVSDPNLPYVPVDSDGDGVTDNYQFPLSQLGFSKEQIAALSSTVNPASSAGGDVYLGMRVIAHGGMVNLNESHPTLIANALGIRTADLFNSGAHPELTYFIHRPTKDGVKYSPQLEEPMLRRRGFLPPRIIAPSLLHGTDLPSVSTVGDMPTKLFPPDPREYPSRPVFESVFDGAHQYVPFTLEKNESDEYVQPYNQSAPDSPSLWRVRMEPFSSFDADPDGNAYDRRHLVTTVSHDDLLSRGGRVKEYDDTGMETGRDQDIREAMIDANRLACAAGVEIPFEYADYPQSIEPSGCDCPTDPNCALNVRKGRLALSLGWLDKVFSDDGDPSNDVITKAQRQRLIHDAFMMLLRNASGAYWEEIDCTGLAAGACVPYGELCDDFGTRKCYDPVTGLSHREALISRTAASLTANTIDYMDFEDIDVNDWDDGIPTRVALRSFDFSNVDTVGRELGPPMDPSRPAQYVFGLERQPYITEVTTAANDTTSLQAWAVELYNPYPDDLVYRPGEDEYVLMQVDPAGTVFEVPLQRDIIGDPTVAKFNVFRSDPQRMLSGVVNINGQARVYDAAVDMQFKNGWTVYLIRRVRLPGEASRTDIVVDQFTVGEGGGNIGKTGPELGTAVTNANTAPYVFSMERFIPNPAPPPTVPRQSPWMATVPDAIERPLGEHTLGKWSDRGDPAPMPVEVQFANTGSFTKSDPANPDRGVAFPTTGSMLMVMRHANRPFSDRTVSTITRGPGGLPGTPVNVDNPALAFTTWLLRETLVPGPLGAKVAVREREQIDNGRMPVFDEPVRECVDGGGTLTGVRCRTNMDCTAGTTCTQVAPGVHHADPSASAVDTPGGTEHLPWGQLLWDYFTVLPLSSDGPYPPWPGPDRPAATAAADSIPRVDLDGLRVHGRININAAPWMVMSGLPLVPTIKIPQSYRGKIETLRNDRRLLAALPPIANVQADQLIVDQAMAIAAYRDGRAILNSGDYGTGDPAPGVTADYPYGRTWDLATPAARRGTGFLTVGELANVRHPGAADQLYRMDYGELDATEPDYVRAVALLASLGDWVTVRSHVFTTYGTLRGEGDYVEIPIDTTTLDDDIERADDVDKRAVRFQETVDRLPTLTGASRPVRIGHRYVGPYIDVRND